MPYTIGLFTTLSNAPSSLFEKTLSLVYEPVLSYLYNNPDSHLTLYESEWMIKYIQRERPEYRSLLQSLIKKGSIEILSGSYSQSILSLLHPKDRVGQIERMTSLIRHEYGVLPESAFIYPTIWQKEYISTLKSAGIERVVTGSGEEDEPFFMKELGKKELIFPSDPLSAKVVHDYSNGELGEEELTSFLLDEVKEDSDKVIFLSIDELVLGANRNHSEIRPGEIVTTLLKNVKSVPLSNRKVTRLGYLPAGWYGKDARNYKEGCFIPLLVENDSFRYLHNRMLSLIDAAQLKSDRFLKKDVLSSLSSISLGSLFILDPSATPLRKTTRKEAWELLLASERSFIEYSGTTAYKEYDLEDLSRSSCVMANKSYEAVISPRGAALTEFDILPFGVNLIDSYPSFGSEKEKLRKSFSDIIVVNNSVYNTEPMFFISEPLDKKRTEIEFLCEDDSLPFQLVKHYKMRSSTFTLDTTVTSEFPIKGEYKLSFYLDSEALLLSSPEQSLMMMTQGNIKSKTVKYYAKDKGGINIYLSSIREFSLKEEVEQKRVETALGNEEFGLFKKITLTFPLEVDKGESVTYRVILRAQGMKKE